MRIVIFTFIFAIAFDLYSKCKFKNVIKSDEVEYTIQNSIEEERRITFLKYILTDD